MAKRMSRAARFDAAMEKVRDAKSDVEELKSEMENWLENIPDNLQGGDKYSEVEQCIDDLDSIINDLESAESTVPDFPGMR